jgi:hypothetical protein
MNRFPSKELEEMENLNASLCSAAQLVTGKHLPEVHDKS